MSVWKTPADPVAATATRAIRNKRLALIVLIGFSFASAADPWVAPRSASRRANPIPNGPKSVAAGKAVFTPNCIPCHGESGKGDGPASSALNPKPANLSDPKVWEQTDGAIFWKISNGRNAMPKWEGALSEEQRWNTINFLRATFGKSHPRQ